MMQIGGVGAVTSAQSKHSVRSARSFEKQGHNLNTCERTCYEVFKELLSIKEFNQFWFQWRVFI